MTKTQRDNAPRVIRLVCGIPPEVEVTDARLLAEWIEHNKQPLKAVSFLGLSDTDFDTYLAYQSEYYNWD